MRKTKRIYHYVLFAVFGILFVLNLMFFYGQEDDFVRLYSFMLCFGSSGGIAGAGIMLILVKTAKLRQSRKLNQFADKRQ